MRAHRLKQLASSFRIGARTLLATRGGSENSAHFAPVEEPDRYRDVLTASLAKLKRRLPAETRYGVAVDVKRAADSYAQGRSLRQIGAELGVPWTARGTSTSQCRACVAAYVNLFVDQRRSKVIDGSESRGGPLAFVW